MALVQGLTPEQQEQISSQLKSGILAKQLRIHIRKEIEALYKVEETLDDMDYIKTIGQRRGLRYVLKLLPEEEK